MKMYNASVEVELREQLSGDQVDVIMETLASYSPAIGESTRGWQSVTISVPATSLAQATSTAVAVVEAALSAPAIAAEVMTSDEFDHRQGWQPTTELVSVAEAAELLGVSRQRVLQRIADRSLPGEKIGRDYGIPRSAVEALVKPS